MPGDLHSRFAASFARYADRTLVEAAGRAWTYAEIEALSARLASRLGELGARAGERVLVQTDKSVETLLLYLAVVRTGAIYLPLNVDYTEAELEYFASDAGPALAVCREGDEPLFERIGKGAVKVTTLAALFANLPDRQAAPAPRQSDDIAAILYTSGTTGKPKGAMLTQRNLVANGETLIDLWRFTPDDRLIHALPIFHVHGLFVAVHCAVFSGASMVFLEKFESGAVVELMAESTVLMGVPTFYIRLLADERFTQQSAANMRLFVSGSAPLSADIHRAFEARCGHRVLERYGMTETGMLTSNPYDGERRAGFVGPPLPDVELRIADFETRQGAAAGRGRHRRSARPQHLFGLLADARKDRERVSPRRVFHHRRHGFHRYRRICAAGRARKGSDHFGRLERLSSRGRGTARRPG